MEQPLPPHLSVQAKFGFLAAPEAFSRCGDHRQRQCIVRDKLHQGPGSISMIVVFFLSFLSLCVGIVRGSAGDYDNQFIWCRKECQDGCNKKGQDSSANLQVLVPEYKTKYLIMQAIGADQSFLSWSCLETCVYECSQSITAQRVQQGLPPWKYFGHWPFIRWYGLEEPASVLFSALNMLTHIAYLAGWYKPLPRSSRMKIYVQLYAIVAINAWMASILYHAKKTTFSTTFDYISALLLLSYGFNVSAVRVILFTNPTERLFIWLISFFSLFLWFSQAYRLYKQVVNFTAHMQLCVFLLLLTTVFYFFYVSMVCNSRHLQATYQPIPIIPSPSSSTSSTDLALDSASSEHLTAQQARQTFDPITLLLGISPNDINFRKAIWYCILSQLWLGGAGLLEVYDFPPLSCPPAPLALTFDAHSLWHFCTIPLGLVWYAFWYYDDLQERELVEAMRVLFESNANRRRKLREGKEE